MRRTQVYITDEQASLLANRAQDAGVSKAEVIRRLLDAGLGLGDDLAVRRRALEETAGILSGAPDWPQWLEGVRGGRDANDRLADLGS